MGILTALLPSECVFQEAQGRSKDQIDGTGMSLGNRKGVRVTGRYVPPVNWSSTGGGPSIVHSPPSASIPSDAPTVISIGPLTRRSPEQGSRPKMDDPSETRVSYGEMGVPRQTMEELKTILRDSPLLSIHERDESKPGSPYTYLHACSSGGGGRPDRRQNDGNSHRLFSTFKPHSDASRRGPMSKESTPIQLPPNMDSSSSFRSDANTNRQPGVTANTTESSSSSGETGASHTGR